MMGEEAATATGGPSAWVTRFAHLIEPRGTVLDVAAGKGRHARWFADNGFTVVAVDRDISALADLPSSSVQVVQADLESSIPWPLEGRQFDAIVVTNYLYRGLFERLLQSLYPGGVLLYETFGLGNETWGRPRNPEFLLHAGELLKFFGTKLNVVAYENGLTHLPTPRVVQRICALGTDRPLALQLLESSEKSSFEP